VEQIISGIVAGCKEANCSLIGGETAEMPGFYQPTEYDLAGFAVGIVENNQIIDGSTIRTGDQIIGLASSGLHSNGYSLVRKIVFEQLHLQPESIIPGCSRRAADELLEPTRIYVEPVLKLARQFRIAGMAHITGGGLYDNIPRILPKTCQALIYEGSWEVPPIFTFLRDAAQIPPDEMYRVFNNGIGFILVASAGDSDEIIQRCSAMGQKAYRIGEIVPRLEGTTSVRIIPA
jgi:phosphoribosylformylglycinamidine cyclo-ligase